MMSVYLSKTHKDVTETDVAESVQGLGTSMTIGVIYYFTIEMYPLKIKL